MPAKNDVSMLSRDRVIAEIVPFRTSDLEKLGQGG